MVKIKLTNNQVIKIIKEFRAGGKLFREGAIMSVFMESEEKANHMLVIHGRTGKPMTTNNMKNVFALSRNQVAFGVEQGAIVVGA